MWSNRNYKNKAWLLLPTPLRTPLMGAIAATSTSQCGTLHANLLTVFEEIRYKIGHNGQVCYLQSACNDAIDPIGRRIEIFDTGTSSALIPLLQDRVFEQPVILGTLILTDREYYTSGEYDFQVVVPFDITSDQTNKLISTLDYYKLVSKRYLITKIKI